MEKEWQEFQEKVHKSETEEPDGLSKEKVQEKTKFSASEEKNLRLGKGMVAHLCDFFKGKLVLKQNGFYFE